MKNHTDTSIFKIITKNLTVICLRLSLKHGNTNFKQNPPFAVKFLQILQQVICFYKEKKYCFHMEQHSNFIFIFIDSKIPLTYTHMIKQLEQLLLTLKEHGQLPDKPASEKDFILFSTAIAYGTVKICTTYEKQPLFHNPIWLGDVKERALILAKVAGTKHFPNFLITQDVYRHLTLAYQERFAQKYYHDHICCYALDTAQIDKPGNYWYSEYYGIGKNFSEHIKHLSLDNR